MGGVLPRWSAPGPAAFTAWRRDALVSGLVGACQCGSHRGMPGAEVLGSELLVQYVATRS